MKEKPKARLDLILSSADNLEDLSRDIVRYFTMNDQLEAALLDDDSPEYHLFNLALGYLDNEKNAQRPQIAHELDQYISATQLRHEKS